MNKIVYLINRRPAQPLIFGHQFDHNDLVIEFQGFRKLRDDSTLYLKIGAPVEALVPLSDDNQITVQNYITKEESKSIPCQLVEYKLAEGSTTEYELVSNSDIFFGTVLPSLDESKIPEVTDPSLDLIYTQMHEMYLTVKNAYESGELKGDKGEKGDKGDTPIKGTDYWTDVDKQEIVDDTVEAVQPAIDAETQRATKAESELSNKVNNKADKTDVNRLIETEKTERKNADTALETKITDETTRAKAAEETNATAITTEVARAKAAENTLQSNIDTEATAREEADEALKTDLQETKDDLTKFKGGYKRNNLWDKAEFIGENIYPGIYKQVTSYEIRYWELQNMNTYLLTVDGTKKYTFSASVRYAVPIKEDKLTSVLEKQLTYVTTIDLNDYPDTKYLAIGVWKSTIPYIICEGDTIVDDILPNWMQEKIDQLKTDFQGIKGNCTLSTTGTFAASGDNLFLTSARSELRKGMRIVFEAIVTSGTDFEVGFSERENTITGEHNVISISANNITYNNTDYAHGLTIEGCIQFILECLNDATANITLICNGNSFKQNISFRQGTVFVPFVRSKGLIATDCKLTFTCVDLLKKIWIFGDSYLSYHPQRWTYYLKEYGYDKNVLMDGFAGETSLNLHQALLKLIKLAKPQYIVWFGGMNDTSDTDDTTPTTQYSEYVNKFINICKEKDIIPILATIPNVPSINHKGKNAWIKASGYRYIDMCHAVGADVTKSWYDGMLSSDNIHPTIKGAKALFAQVLLDLPEIMLDI